MPWHKITVYKGHRGAGRRETAVAYIFANNVIDVFKRYKTMPGVKRSYTPDIVQLAPEQEGILERKIIREGKIRLDRAKRRGYYGKLPD